MNLYQKPVSSDSDIHNNIPLTVLEFYSANYMPEEPGMLDYETVGHIECFRELFLPKKNTG